MLEHLRRHQPAPDRAREKRRPIAPRHGIHPRRRADVGDPGDEEHAPDVQGSPTGEEAAQRDGGVRGHRGKDVLDGGEQPDQGIERAGGKGLEGSEEAGHYVSTATAITATPSPRPIHPIPSLVLAFTDTVDGGTSSAPASRSCIASMCGASLGRSQITVMSACTNSCPASSVLRYAWLSSWIESACFQRGSVSGNSRPMSPRAAAPRMASVRAWATASASEWPSSPLGCGISTPPTINLRWSANRCPSYPMPTRISGLEDPDGEVGGVLGVVDPHRGNGDAGGELRDGEQRVHPVQRPGRERDADHGEGGERGRKAP